MTANTLPTKALTLKPEFASLVLNGEKLIENRSWGQNVRGTIAIHRGGKDGAVICLADVIDVITPAQARKRFPSQKKHIFGPLCWVLSNIRRLDNPAYCRGQLSLWNLSDSVLSVIKENLTNGEESN